MNSKNLRFRVGERITIFPRGKKGVYCAEFWFNGHRRQSLKTSDKRIAVQRAVKLADSLFDGTYEKPPLPITNRQAIEDYLLQLQTDDRRPKTLVRYRGELYAWRDFLESAVAPQLKQVTPGLFDRFRQLRKVNHKPSTLYHEGVVIKQFLKWCKSRKLLVRHPLEEVKLFKPRRQEQSAFRLELVNEILKCSRGQRSFQFAIAAFAGLREAQICLLRPEDVDLAAGWIQINPVAGAKNKEKTVRVPIHPRLQAILQRLPKTQRPWLFTAPATPKYPMGDHQVNPKRLYEDLLRILKKLGLPIGRGPRGYTFHSFRRFFRTFTTNAGVPTELVDLWMGHGSSKSMAAVYYVSHEDDSQHFMKKVPFGTGEPDTDAGRKGVCNDSEHENAVGH